MQDQDRKVPSHERTYGALRDMILFGQLAPGQAVTIQGLTTALQAGMTPVREAIRRLIAEGALTLQDNRRVSVPLMTRETHDQLAFARLAIEPHLAHLAINHLDEPLIAKLQSCDEAVNVALGNGAIGQYLRANYTFHFTLYDAAQAPVLLDLARSLWLRVGPGLRVVTNRYGQLGLPDLHAEALSAMRSRDGAALAQIIKRDIEQGLDQIAQALSETEQGAADCAAL